ncbi:MAG TPA: glycosyltransferase family 4 protein [Methylomirabilota bacterium]|nr:glycosyltransferase family 4 protein [Methylomirabilota bacterium]
MIKTVLFATVYYPPFAPGGAEWTNARWAAALARRGRRVVVVTPNYGAAPHEEVQGVAVRRVPFPRHLAPGSGEVSWLAHHNLIFDRYFGWQIARVAQHEGVDLIHAQDEGTLIAAWRAGRARRLPLVVTIRDVGLLCPLGMCTLFEPWATFDCTKRQYVDKCVPFFMEHYAAGPRGLRAVALRARLRLGWRDQSHRHRALREVDGVIGVSGGILSIFPQRLAPAGRRRVVHATAPTGPPPDDAAAASVRSALGVPSGPLVLYAGKRSLGKGTTVLLDALGSIRATVPGVRFAFAGKGELALPLASDIHDLRELSQSTLFSLYRAADVIVAPALWPEPFSRVILEAMWAGRPVVASAAGGIPEQIEDGVSGVLVPKGDPAALANAVSGLLRDPARRARMGVAAAARAATFSEERAVTALLDAYEAFTTGAT